MIRSFQIGSSLFDKPGSEKVAALVEKAKKNNVELIFPVDYITADKFDKDAKVRSKSFDIEFFFFLNLLDGKRHRLGRNTGRMDGSRRWPKKSAPRDGAIVESDMAGFASVQWPGDGSHCTRVGR